MPGELRGRWLWMELLTDDLDASTAFYRTVFGWGSETFLGTGTPYTMFTANGAPIGGAMRIPPGASAAPTWLGYLGVPDVDAAVDHVLGRGGHAYVQPTDVPTVGRFAVLADPWGAIFSVYRPVTGSVQEESAATSEFSWHELMSGDYQKADDFYSKLFGWEKKSEFDMGPEMGTYHMFGRDRFTYGGMMNKPAFVPAPPHWLHYVQVDSADEAAERATKAGGKVVNGPMEVPGGDRIAQIIDPQGAAFAVHSKAK